MHFMGWVITNERFSAGLNNAYGNCLFLKANGSVLEWPPESFLVERQWYYSYAIRDEAYHQPQVQCPTFYLFLMSILSSFLILSVAAKCLAATLAWTA